MAKKGSLRINIEYLLVGCVLRFFAVLPLSAAMALGRLLGRLVFWVPKLRRVGMRNLQLAFPSMKADDQQRLLRRSLDNLGRVVGVFCHFAHRDPSSLRQLIQYEGRERFEAAQREGRGVIFFTGHLGAWDLCGFAAGLLGHQIGVLARPVDNPKIDRLIKKTRTRFGNRLIDKHAAARPMLEILRQRGTLGMLIDINMLGREGIFVNFFGIPASTTFILAKLALRTGAVVLPACAPWDSERRNFIVRVGEPVTIERTGNEEEDVRRLTAACTAVIEDYVRRYPDQWLWIHKRWRTRPSGEPDLYA